MQRVFRSLGKIGLKQIKSKQHVISFQTAQLGGHQRWVSSSCRIYCSKKDSIDDFDAFKSDSDFTGEDLSVSGSVSNESEATSMLFDGQQADDFDVFSDEFIMEEAQPNLLPSAVINGIRIPTEETHKALVNGVPYNELPIAHIKATWQNTHVSLSNHSGSVMYTYSSGGTVGFKNAKKKTNVAAQSAGLTVGQKAKSLGINDIRICFNGIGQSRLAACKGLEQAGLNIISLTDDTRMPWGAYTPRKRRR